MHHSREGFADFDPLRMDDNYEPTELMRERAARAKGLTPWEKVKAARKVDRPSATDYWKIFLMNLWSSMVTDTFGMIRQS